MWRKWFAVIAVVLIVQSPSARAEDPAGLIQSPVLKKALQELTAGRPADAGKTLSSFKPGVSSPETTAQFYFIRGRTMDALRRYQEAADDFRHAYLSLPSGEMKELSLLMRGEAYLKMKYYYESASDFKVFLKIFPGSRYEVRAQAELADSLAGTGAFRESLEYYDKAPDDPGALLGKARALQLLGRAKEAGNVYAFAFSKAPSYVYASEEAAYDYCENLRENGRFDAAEQCLKPLKSPDSRKKAELSLGLMAGERSRTGEAIKHFGNASNATDKKVRSRALLCLADALMKAGKTKEAKAYFERIRYEYPYGREFEKAVLGLSRISRGEGDYETSVRLLKGLVFRKNQVNEALDELEMILRETAKKNDIRQLTAIWKSVGRWLLSASREDLLLGMLEAMKDSEREFLEISRYLAKYGSEDSRRRSGMFLAGFYADRGERTSAREYLGRIKNGKGGEDAARIEARLLIAEKNFKAAAAKLLSLRRNGPADLKLFGDVFSSGTEAGKIIGRYEKLVRETGGRAEDCVLLGDYYFGLGKKAEALHYYRAASEKAPDDEWPLYRTAALMSGDGATELLKKIAGGSSPVSRSAGARLREMALAQKMAEVN